MEPTFSGPVGYLVVAEVAHGRPAPEVYGDVLHATVESAALEVRDMGVRLGLQQRGSTLLVPDEIRPAAVAVTPDGDAWAVHLRPVRTLALRQP